MLARPIVRRWLTALVPYGWCLRFARWLLGARHAAVAIVDGQGEPRALLSDPTCAVLCEVTEVLHVKRAADGADVLLFGSQRAFYIGRLVLEPGWLESLYPNATAEAPAEEPAQPQAEAEEASRADALRPGSEPSRGGDADEDVAPYNRLLQAGVEHEAVVARMRAAGIDPSRLAPIDAEAVEPKAAVQAAVELGADEGPATIQLG